MAFLRASRAWVFALLFGLVWLGSGCSPTAPTTPAVIHITVHTANETIPVQIPAGSTVQQALDAAKLSLGSLDRTEPPVFTVLTDGADVRLIRVTEKYEVEQEVIPFEQQTLHNESLPQDSKIYLQKGKNGLQEVTYHQVFEDGVEVGGKTVVKTEVIEEPVAEIIMSGIQTPFVSIAVPGKLIYLRDGNAWMIEKSTGNRRAVVTTGDLDGRVLSLSSDGTWLLFTRLSKEEGQINRLWAVDITAEEPKPVDLKVDNVIHFADWLPGSDEKVIYSTVEPREAAPGWQANNDLRLLRFSANGWIKPATEKDVLLQPNTGGVYGWWGMSFAWSPEGDRLAFVRPDSIGMIDFNTGEQTTQMEITPLQTRGDWAWVPGLAWGPDGKTLFTVDHVPQPGSLSPEESPVFDLTGVPLDGGSPVHLVSQAGMFAYPIVSPVQPQLTGEQAYQVAFLQAIFPGQSDTSRYQVQIMDRDGSNRRTLFPGGELSGGMEPQQDWGAWSPAPMPESGHTALAVIYQGNLWLVDTVSGEAKQITGDGLTTRVLWK